MVTCKARTWPRDLVYGSYGNTQGWLCEAVLGGLREWQRPAAFPTIITPTAATPSTASQLTCLLTATAPDSCTADDAGSQTAATSAASRGASAPVLATVVTSQLEAYWFTKPLVALYAKVGGQAG
eukprot:scaffold84120_cov19-Tisochrysis_lutea.AAC.1